MAGMLHRFGNILARSLTYFSSTAFLITVAHPKTICLEKGSQEITKGSHLGSASLLREYGGQNTLDL
jgi:hypothetical protein